MTQYGIIILEVAMERDQIVSMFMNIIDKNLKRNLDDLWQSCYMKI